MIVPTRMVMVGTGMAASAVVASSCLTFVLVRGEHVNLVAADRKQVAAISMALSGYGLTDAGWQDVGGVVTALSTATGKRIRITTQTGAPVADTDVLAGHAPRPTAGPAILIDPRPQLRMPADQIVLAPMVAGAQIRAFRQSVGLAGCLRESRVPIKIVPRPSGVPRLTAADGISAATVRRVAARCPTATPAVEESLADTAAIHRCISSDAASRREQTACVERVFAERTGALTAQPVVLHVGARGEPTTWAITPLIGAVASIMVLALGCLLWAARVLVRRISRRLAGADLGAVHRQDEVAAMASLMHENDERRLRQLAHVAHELRNPLTNMRAYLEGLSDGIISPEPKLFALLHDEAMLQQRIIDDLQPRGETAELTYHRESFDVGELVESCWLAHLPKAEAAGLRLTIGGDGYLPVSGDPDRLRQVVGNIITNAVRYTPAGGVVDVRSRYEDGWAALEIHDTGIGIDPDDLPKIFDHGWRADAARDTAGSGLGLSIVRQIVLDHGGDLTARSKPGEGTTFTVYLPLTHVSSDRGVAQVESAGAAAVSPRKVSR